MQKICHTVIRLLNRGLGGVVSAKVKSHGAQLETAKTKRGCGVKVWRYGYCAKGLE